MGCPVPTTPFPYLGRFHVESWERTSQLHALEAGSAHYSLSQQREGPANRLFSGMLAASSCSVQTFEGKPFFCEMLGFFLTAYLHGMLSFLQMNKQTNQPEQISVACN